MKQLYIFNEYNCDTTLFIKLYEYISDIDITILRICVVSNLHILSSHSCLMRSALTITPVTDSGQQSIGWSWKNTTFIKFFTNTVTDKKLIQPYSNYHVWWHDKLLLTEFASMNLYIKIVYPFACQHQHLFSPQVNTAFVLLNTQYYPSLK